MSISSCKFESCPGHKKEQSIDCSFFCIDVANYCDQSRKLRNYFSQPMFVAEPYTNIKGEFVDIKDVLDNVENILKGTYDNVDEIKFRYIGKYNGQ